MRRYAEPLDPTPGTEGPRFTPPHQRCLTVCFAHTVATLSPRAAGPLIPAPTRRAAGSRPSWQDPDRVQYQCLELPEAPAVKRLGREREILRGLLDQSCSNLLVTHQSVLPRSRRVGPKKSMNRPSHTPIMSLRPRIGACRVTQACGESQAYCPVASSCGGRGVRIHDDRRGNRGPRDHERDGGTGLGVHDRKPAGLVSSDASDLPQHRANPRLRWAATPS